VENYYGVVDRTSKLHHHGLADWPFAFYKNVLQTFKEYYWKNLLPFLTFSVHFELFHDFFLVLLWSIENVESFSYVWAAYITFGVPSYRRLRRLHKEI